MAAYNSSVGLNRDDANLTIINQLYDHDDDQINSCIPIERRLQQTNPLYDRTNIDNRQDYVFVDHDRQETAKQLEQILNYYRLELKQESNAQSDCNRQLVTRLIDFIRPVYSSNKTKMNDLDILFEEIGALHHARFLEQKEKTERFHGEISHLKKLIVTSANEGDSTMTKIYRINSMINYEQWMEMEEETRKLHNLVDAQRDRINELIKLVSNEELSPLHASAHKTTVIPRDEISISKQKSTVSNTNGESTSAIQIPAVVDRQQDSGTDRSQTPTSQFHSPGTSPIHSLTDFLTKSLVDTVDNKTQNEERSPGTTRKLPELSRIQSYNDKKSCFICHHEFLSTANEYDIISHVQKCLSKLGIHDLSGTVEYEQYQCPNCSNFNRSVKQNIFLQSIRTCPFCEAIFNVSSMSEQQFGEHTKAHTYQKRK